MNQTINIETLQGSLCKAFCADIQVSAFNGGLLQVSTPFYFADGDPYQLYIKELAGGGIRLTDMGHTFMQLSYENDVDKFLEGTRGKLFEQILAEFDLQHADGEFYVDTEPAGLSSAIFRLGQGITRISDLTFLNRARAESTFYEDLNEQLGKLIDASKIQRDYLLPGMENARDYPIDWRIEGKNAPLFLFGIPNRDKARLTTIILEHLLRANADFESLLIFADQGSIPKGDLARLSNVGGEMIASPDAEDDLRRKVLRRVA